MNLDEMIPMRHNTFLVSDLIHFWCGQLVQVDGDGLERGGTDRGGGISRTFTYGYGVIPH